MTQNERLQHVRKLIAEHARPAIGKSFVDLDKPHYESDLGDKRHPVKTYIGVSDGEEHDGHD